MLDYKKIKLDDYNLEVEVGVVPNNLTSDFLSSLKVGNTVAKHDYEDFLLSGLIKNFPEVIKKLGSVDELGRNSIRIQLLENIYQLNSKLKPGHVVIHNNRLLHTMDSIRKGGPSEPVLTMNPGWLGMDTADSKVFPEPVKKLLNSIWEECKKDSSREYVMGGVNVIDMDLPVLVLAKSKVSLNDLIIDFIFKRCDGNLFSAKYDQRLWIGYVLAVAIPHIEKIIYSLVKSNYMDVYTENVVYTQMYMAVLKINPELDWDHIDWNSFQSPDTSSTKPNTDNIRRISSRNPITQNRNRSSREEAEKEKPKFADTSYHKVLGLSDAIKKRIIGQDQAVDSVCEAIAVARVGLRGDKKPIGTFLFAGNTGVGKTELAKVLADELTGHEPIRIDCSEYQQAHEISKIFGAPPGYVGFEDEGKHPYQSAPPSTVASKLKEQPFSIVLFDEIEKADKAIDHVLLQIMDEGRVTSGRGEVISFNNAIVILTSNVGVREAAEVQSSNKLGFGEDDRDFDDLRDTVIDSAIRDRFKPEFRNRLTETVIFNFLDKDACKGIVDVLLGKTKENLEKAQHATMKWNDSIREFVLEEGFSEEFGAREMERVIQKRIELPIAKFILNNYVSDEGSKIPEGSTICLTMDNDELKFDIEEMSNEKIDIEKEGSTNTKRPVSRKRTGSNKT